MFEILLHSNLGWVLLSFAIVPFLTYFVTSIRFWYQARPGRLDTGQEPPTLPYALPWIGSAIDLISNTHKFLAYVK